MFGGGMDQSDAGSSVMVRAVGSESGYAASEVQQARVVDNTRLSALTNRIMELVIDNIKMVHMNTKLVDYCKRMSIQHEQSQKQMQTRVETTESTAEQSSEDLNELNMQLEEMRAKVSGATRVPRRSYRS